MFVALTPSACSEAAEKAAAEGEEKEEEGAEGQEKKDEGKSFMMLQGPEGQPSLTFLLDEAAGRMDITQLPAEDYVALPRIAAAYHPILGGWLAPLNAQYAWIRKYVNTVVTGRRPG